MADHYQVRVKQRSPERAPGKGRARDLRLGGDTSTTSALMGGVDVTPSVDCAGGVG